MNHRSNRDVVYRITALDAFGNESFVSHFAIVSAGGGDKPGGGKGGGPKTKSNAELLAAVYTDESVSFVNDDSDSLTEQSTSVGQPPSNPRPGQMAPVDVESASPDIESATFTIDDDVDEASEEDGELGDALHGDLGS